MRHRSLLVGALAALLLLAAGTTAAPAADVPGPVTGRVVGSDGQPSAGVLVQMTAYGERVPVTQTTTASDGTFALPGTERPARFVLVVCGSDAACTDTWQATEIVKTYVGPGEQALTLPALHGYFTTDLSGATTSPAVDVGDVHVVRPATLTVVDDTGHWVPPFTGPAVSELWPDIHQDVTVFPVLPPGTHEVVLDWLRRTVTLTPGESARLRFGPRPALTGRILLGGRPVRGEPVVVTAPTGRPHGTATGRDGRYRTGPLPDGARLIVRLGARNYGYLAPGDGPKGVYHLTLHQGEVRDLSLAVRARSRGAIAVTAAPDSFSFVSARRVGGPWMGQLNLRDDRARTGGLAPGRYVLTATWRTWSAPTDQQDIRADRVVVRVRAGHTTRAHLAPPTGNGTATLHADPGSFVRLETVSPDATYSTREVPASGDVVVSGLPAGEYDVTVARDEYATPSDPVRVRVGSEPVDVTLPAPPAVGSVRVRLVDPDTGQPWPWTEGVVEALRCGDMGTVPIVGDVFVGDAEPGTYSDCETFHLWSDPGVPGTSLWGVHPAVGTLVVRPGEETTADLAVDLTP